MKLELSSEEIIELLEGRLAVGMVSDRVGPIHTDTRHSLKDAWFLALNGPKFDGHDFIGEAFSCGAIGCIVNERTGYAIAETSFPLIAVEDTLIAYGRLARNWRKRLGFKVVFVVSEEREQSSQVACDLAKSSSCASNIELIDTRLMRIEHCFEKVLSISESEKCLLVNLVPNNLSEAKKLIESLSPDILCVLGEPFGYMRLFESKEDIESVSGLLYQEISNNKGLVIWASSCLVPSEIANSKDCKLIAKSDQELSAIDNDAQENGLLNMAPESSQANPNSKWCLEKLAELIESKN